MRPGRRIAFDYGQVRIGVAVSDVSGLIATPIATLLAQSDGLREELSRFFTEYEPIYIVIGQPRHLSGAQSATMESVSKFGELIASISQAPIHFVDERLSTVFAARTLRASGKNAKEAKSLIAAMAAVSILESALERERIAGQFS